MTLRLLSRLPAFALAFLLFFSTLGFAASAAGYDFPEGSASVTVTLDGAVILKDKAAIINSTTYIPLRDASELIGADSISWDAKTQTATVKKGNTVLKVKNNGNYLEASGRYFYSPARVLNIGGRLSFPCDPLQLYSVLTFTGTARRGLLSFARRERSLQADQITMIRTIFTGSPVLSARRRRASRFSVR